MRSRCPVCGCRDLELLLDVREVPLQCTQLLPSRASAVSARLGDLSLVACTECGLLFNALFDQRVIAYDGNYENSQFYSPTFREYAEHLAASLVERHDLRSGTVVEVGNGKGDFLAMLCRAGAQRAIGFDPSYNGELDDELATLPIHVLRRVFEASTSPDNVNLFCLRHVLEHKERPVKLLTEIRNSMTAGTSLYVEVPNARFTLSDAGIWEFIYQHCCYFSEGALGRALACAGLDTAYVGTAFGGQFLSAEAVSDATTIRTLASSQRAETAAFLSVARRASARHAQAIEHWTKFLQEREGLGIALWGAGSKGTTFLNVVPNDIQLVIDINPRKVGCFVPGTGQPIVAPDALGREVPAPEVVILSNAAYVPEVRRQLSELGCASEIVHL